MLKIQPNDTDLVNSMVELFKTNSETLTRLVAEVNRLSLTDLDPITQVKLKNLRREILVDDVRHQEAKIEKITGVLDSIVCPTI